MTINNLLQHFDLFLLVSLRVLAFVAASPLTSMSVWPSWAKIALAFGVSYVVVPMVSVSVPNIFRSPGAFVVDGTIEVIIGLLLGFIATLIFSAIAIAGQIADIQIGFGLSQVLSPGQTAPMGIFANFYNLLFTLYFIGMGGLDGLMLSVLHSFQVIPVSSLHLPSQWPGMLLQLMAMVMALGVELSAPLLAALFLSDITFAFLSRAVPQMNVFVVGLPVKVFAGLTIFALMMPGVIYVFHRLFMFLFQQMQSMLQAIGG